MKKPWRSLAAIVILVLLFSFIVFTQQRQIRRLEERLEHAELKYDMLFRDPIVRNAIENGG